jgi:hypothetical protein
MGFKIQVPNAQAKQIQKTFEQPHPLIKRIDVVESPDNANNTELVFITEKKRQFFGHSKRRHPSPLIL